ncbi:BET domain-containing protein, partial [Sporobolomyces salmoneus]|uniref:BET domain-containing protein n=1 Tax=Sporobolomyces salmoneus TaxID=183962 RepID=UPI00316F2081
LGGDIEVTQSVWTTDWIQGRAFLTLDVHESKVGIKAEVEKNGGGGGGGVKRENVENSNEAEPKRIKLEKDKEDKGKASARMSAHHGAGGGGGNRRHTPVQQEERVDFDMKRELAVKLATFEGEQLQEALDIIRRSQPDLLGAPDQGIDLDIDQLNQGTLVPLYRYVCPRSPQDPGTDEST